MKEVILGVYIEAPLVEIEKEIRKMACENESCQNADKSIDRSFNFCPVCGTKVSLQVSRNKEIQKAKWLKFSTAYEFKDPEVFFEPLDGGGVWLSNRKDETIIYRSDRSQDFEEINIENITKAIENFKSLYHEEINLIESIVKKPLVIKFGAIKF